MPASFRHPFLALGLMLTLAACGGDDAPATTEPASAAMAVTVAPVTVREIARSVGVSGEIAAVEEMLLGVEVSGLRVTALLVDVGAPVRRGQVLLRLDRRMLDSERAQAEAALREAEAGAALARACAAFVLDDDAFDFLVLARVGRGGLLHRGLRAGQAGGREECHEQQGGAHGGIVGRRHNAAS